jgi:hypothetical protein
MLRLAGPDAQVHFTHLSKSSSQALSTAFGPQAASDGSRALAKAFCHQLGVLDLMTEKQQQQSESVDSVISLENVCLLDPKAEIELSPDDGQLGRFQWFLFGVSGLHLHIFFWFALTDQQLF